MVVDNGGQYATVRPDLVHPHSLSQAFCSYCRQQTTQNGGKSENNCVKIHVRRKGHDFAINIAWTKKVINCI